MGVGIIADQCFAGGVFEYLGVAGQLCATAGSAIAPSGWQIQVSVERGRLRRMHCCSMEGSSCRNILEAGLMPFRVRSYEDIGRYMLFPIGCTRKPGLARAVFDMTLYYMLALSP